jgi:hypothetical protein
MAINDNEIVSSSKYDIYSKLMLIASKYFDVQNEDFLKTGLFGYVTESMASIARDSSIHKTMLYNESFLNTAVMPKSVYNWAKMFGVSITAATPSYAEIQVTIPIESLIFATASTIPNASKYGTEVTTTFGQKQMMILDRENQFIAGEFKFTLERSILIFREGLDGIITVKYCQTESPTTLLHEISNFYIKTYTTTDNYISFVVRAYQYDLVNIEKQISSSSFLDTKIHLFNFNDQFVGAKLNYEKNGRTTPLELRFSNISSPTASKNFAYYNLVDTNSLQISFSSASGDFIPTANSTLKLQLYTTKGAEGNITFTGDVIFRLQEESLKNIPILCNFFNDISIGGVDAPNISRIKSTIINEISTRDVIVTETDLNNYFLILTSLLETVNDGKITFIKKRDDILRRVFSAYILMRDGLDIDGQTAESSYVSKVIPTNTLTADFDISSNVSKPFGTIIKRKAGKLNEFEYVPSSALDGSDDYYVVPFYMRVNLDPFRKVKYIYNLTDDSTTLSYQSISSTSSSVYVLPSTISLKRGIEGSNTSPYYLVTATFVTNQNFGTTITSGSGIFSLSFFRRGSSVKQGGTEFTFTNGQNLSITSVQSEEDPNRFSTTMEFAINVNNDGSEFDFSSDQQVSNFGTFLKLTHNNVTISVPEDARIQLDFVGLRLTTGGTISSSFISDRNLLFFRNLDELMYSDILLNKISPRWNLLGNKVTFSTSAPTSPTPTAGDYWIDSTDLNNLIINIRTLDNDWDVVEEDAVMVTSVPVAPPAGNLDGKLYIYKNGDNYSMYKYDAKEYVTSVTVKDIPVVHQSFFTSEANQTKFIRQLFIYIDTLRENLGKLETNTFFDLKFYNTFGDSQYYNTPRTDMNLELDVYVFEYSDDLASAIRDYVRLLVDSSNNNKALKVSSIIKELTTAFSRYIDHVDFKGLNGTFTQYISEITTVATNLYAPEYLNISDVNLANVVVKQIDAED